MQLETLISIAYITKRTLIVPPKSIVDHLDGKNIDEFDVFDWDSLSSLICLSRDEPNIKKCSFLFKLILFLICCKQKIFVN